MSAIGSYRNKYFDKAKRDFRVTFYPFVWLYEKIRPMIYKTGLEKCLEFHEEGLCEYLTKGTNVDKPLMQKVINRIKRDWGYKSNSVSGELDYHVKKQSFVTIKYAIDNKMTVAMAYNTIKNNPELWTKYMES